MLDLVPGVKVDVVISPTRLLQRVKTVAIAVAIMGVVPTVNMSMLLGGRYGGRAIEEVSWIQCETSACARIAREMYMRSRRIRRMGISHTQRSNQSGET